MIRLEWKDCRLTAEGTQVVLENAAGTGANVMTTRAMAQTK